MVLHVFGFSETQFTQFTLIIKLLDLRVDGGAEIQPGNDDKH